MNPEDEMTQTELRAVKRYIQTTIKNIIWGNPYEKSTHEGYQMVIPIEKLLANLQEDVENIDKQLDQVEKQ